jgi:hypothetical protein
MATAREIVDDFRARLNADPDGFDAAWKRETDRAFDQAIATGRLSMRRGARYVGDYMWMGPDFDGGDAFKHRITREYLHD